jgi:hypothetical protein
MIHSSHFNILTSQCRLLAAHVKESLSFKPIKLLVIPFIRLFKRSSSLGKLAMLPFFFGLDFPFPLPTVLGGGGRGLACVSEMPLEWAALELLGISNGCSDGCRPLEAPEGELESRVISSGPSSSPELSFLGR